MVDKAALVELLPGLLMTGKSEEALQDVHVLLTQAKPVIAAGVLSDTSKLVPALEAMAKDGRYDAILEAVYSLSKIAVALVKNNPADLTHVMAVARSMIPAQAGAPTK